MYWMIPVALLVLVAGLVAVGPLMSDVEQARYEVLDRDGAFELREYAPHIVAEVEVSGSRKEAIRKGFQEIADYIFGNNRGGRKMAMTAPVQQQAGEKIAMTAPVQQEGAGQSWHIRFVMPAAYTMDTLPRPNNPAVHLVQVPAVRMAAVRFSGMANDARLREKTAALEAWLKARSLKAAGSPVYAFYNPPWTLPPFRRNEVLIPIAP